MTPEEYKAKNKEINAKINTLNDELRNTQLAYIEEHRTLADGDLVEVVTPARTSWGDRDLPEHREKGIVFGANCHDDGEMYYRMWKVKKDGTKSAHRLRYHTPQYLVKL